MMRKLLIYIGYSFAVCLLAIMVTNFMGLIVKNDYLDNYRHMLKITFERFDYKSCEQNMETMNGNEVIFAGYNSSEYNERIYKECLLASKQIIEQKTLFDKSEKLIGEITITKEQDTDGNEFYNITWLETNRFWRISTYSSQYAFEFEQRINHKLNTNSYTLFLQVALAYKCIFYEIQNDQALYKNRKFPIVLEF